MNLNQEQVDQVMRDYAADLGKGPLDPPEVPVRHRTDEDDASGLMASVASKVAAPLLAHKATYIVGAFHSPTVATIHLRSAQEGPPDEGGWPRDLDVTITVVPRTIPTDEEIKPAL